MAEFVQTTTFANGQTADGGQVNTEIVNLGNSVNNIVNDQIDASAAIDWTKINYGSAAATYSPTFDATASLTWNTSATTTTAEWSQTGKMVDFQISRYATTGGSGTGFLRITLPVAAVLTATGAFGGGCYIALAGTRYPAAWYNVSATQIHITRHDGTEFSAGGVVEVIVQGRYRVA